MDDFGSMAASFMTYDGASSAEYLRSQSSYNYPDPLPAYSKYALFIQSIEFMNTYVLKFRGHLFRLAGHISRYLTVVL